MKWSRAYGRALFSLLRCSGGGLGWGPCRKSVAREEAPAPAHLGRTNILHEPASSDRCLQLRLVSQDNRHAEVLASSWPVRASRPDASEYLRACEVSAVSG